MKNKYVAALLAIFGGIFGIHKFYLRDTGAGIFYVFLTMMTIEVFPIPMLLGFIDGMRYLMMPPEEFDRKFNRKSARRKKGRRPKRQREYYEQRPSAKGRKASVIRANPFKKSGIKKYKEYDIEEAIEDFHKALKIDPNDISLYFNLACAYSLMEDKDEAFKYLELSVTKGLKDHSRIMSHDDLAYLRIQPEFQDFKSRGFKRTRQAQRGTEENTNKPMDDILLAQLNRLMELRKKGVLTEQEFARERKKVLAR